MGYYAEEVEVRETGQGVPLQEKQGVLDAVP